MLKGGVMNLVDIAIIIFVGFQMFQGFRRGFIKTLFDTIGIIAAFFLSKMFYFYAENFLLNNTKLYVKTYDFIATHSEGFKEILKGNSNDIVTSFREALHLPIELQTILSNIFNYSTSASVDAYKLFIDSITMMLIRSLSFIITFLIFYVILIVLSNVINTLFKLPGLNIANRMFGALGGAVKSLIVLYIIFALCSPVIGFTQNNKIVNEVIESESSKIFYENNIILNYLSYKNFYGNHSNINNYIN
jgi:uncharacterized membrane protein required for colicin V production